MKSAVEIKYRLCTKADIPEIELFVKNAIDKMNDEGIPQWDEIYPARSDWESDIKNETLYAGTINGKIAVVFALNKEQDEEYLKAEWTERSGDFFVIHRLCVNPEFQNCGVAGKTLCFAENLALKKGAHSIRLDMFPKNPYAEKLYASAGYKKTGEANWRKGLFYLMEKVLI